MLVMHAPPGFTHGEVAVAISSILRAHVFKHRLGSVVSESGFILTHRPDTVRGPDVAFVCKERLKGKLLDAFYDGTPDLAVEVLSPNDNFHQVEQKLWQYFEAGCRMAWVVDPREQTVTVRKRNDQARVLQGKDILEGDDVVPGFRCRVWELFMS